jgi:beta-lactamase superfamily II metal-dependent hydrolase
LRHFSPDTLWVNSIGQNEREFQNLLNEANSLQIKIRIPEAGEAIESNDTLLIENIGSLHLQNNTENDNNKSLVIKVANEDVAVLLPGDIEHHAEQQLLLGRNNIQADILLAPHHGSATSSSTNFLQTVSPEYIVISAGKFRKNKFPAPEILKRYEKISTVFNTAIAGTVSFKINGDRLEVETFNSKKKAEIPPGKT